MDKACTANGGESCSEKFMKTKRSVGQPKARWCDADFANFGEGQHGLSK